jgi:DNA-binding IclR family transcriptional regulator
MTMNPPAVKSISRAASILFCLSDGTSTLTDIAGCCHLSKSTVHRLLRALEESHLATQDPLNHRYYLGPMLTGLALNPQIVHSYLIMCAVEEMKRISDIAEDTVTLDAMIAIKPVPLYEIPSKQNLRVIEDAKRIGPLFAGARAKVMFSQLNDEELKIVLKNISIAPVTKKTVTDKDALMAQIYDIRKQGYAVTYGERIDGAICLAAPVLKYICPVALSVIGPESRIQPRINKIVKELKASANRISDSIAEVFNSN